MATIGQILLETLVDGPVYGRDLASRLGVPTDSVRLAGHRLAQRGYVQRAEGATRLRMPDGPTLLRGDVGPPALKRAILPHGDGFRCAPACGI